MVSYKNITVKYLKNSGKHHL